MLFRTRSLRTRLTLAYSIVLTLALLVVASISWVLLDQVESRSINRQLVARLATIESLVVVRNDRLVLLVSGHAQFAHFMGTRVNGAILDDDGSVVISTVTSIPPAVMAAARSTRAVNSQNTVLSETGWLRVRAENVPVSGPPRGRVVVWRSLESIRDIDRLSALMFGSIIPVVVVIAFIGGGTVARRGLQPLETIATLASEIEAHDLSRRIELPVEAVELGELGRLGMTFNRMLDRLQAAFDRERRFTADASHELRAPLSVIRAEADLALLRERTASEYRAALVAIAREADHLDTITRDLLAAIRRESDSIRPSAEVDLAPVAMEAAQRFAGVARKRDIELLVSVAGNLKVKAEPDALSRVIVALVDNALKHVEAGGTIRIDAERSDRDVVLTVSDDGCGFSPKGLVHACERFWREDSARGRSGSGLGLAIVENTVENFGGSIALANNPDHGAVVRVTLPAW